LCFHKAEAFLISFQKKARALNEPAKPLDPTVQLVAHPVGKKSLNDSSTHSFSFPSSDQTHDDKVSCIQDSLVQFPTLLFVGAVEKKIERLRVHDFIFSAGCKFIIFERKKAVASSRLYCASTVI
jgi:hypothetical protein